MVLGERWGPHHSFFHILQKPSSALLSFTHTHRSTGINGCRTLMTHRLYQCVRIKRLWGKSEKYEATCQSIVVVVSRAGGWGWGGVVLCMNYEVNYQIMFSFRLIHPALGKNNRITEGLWSAGPGARAPGSVGQGLSPKS